MNGGSGREPPMKKWWLFLLKLALTVACLWWAFWGTDVRSTPLAHPGQLGWGWLAAGLGLGGVTVALSALRWRIFLAAQGVMVSFARAVELTLIGNLFSMMSVGGLAGDAARVLLLVRDRPKRKLAVTVSVVADHLSGMVGLVLLFFAFSAGRYEALEAPSALGRGVMRFAYGYLGGGLVLLLIGFVVMSPLVHGRVHRGGRWIRWEFMRTVPEAWDMYRQKWRHALGGVAVACVMLLVYFLTFWCGARAVGCGIGAGTALTAMPVIDAISSIPVSVSGIGVREKLFAILFGDLAGVDAELAVAGSLAGFFCHLAWALAGAVLFVRHRGEVTAREIEEYHG
jgi:uncharacterized membrane protein YbhN (UPF0104 family)